MEQETPSIPARMSIAIGTGVFTIAFCIKALHWGLSIFNEMLGSVIVFVHNPNDHISWIVYSLAIIRSITCFIYFCYSSRSGPWELKFLIGRDKEGIWHRNHQLITVFQVATCIAVIVYPKNDHMTVFAYWGLLAALFPYLLLPFVWCGIDFIPKDEDGAPQARKLALNIIKFKGEVGSENCVICFEDFRVEETLNQVPGCMHSYHKRCLDQWISYKQLCPLCNKELNV